MSWKSWETKREGATDKTQWEMELNYPDQDHQLAHGEAVLSNRKRTATLMRPSTISSTFQLGNRHRRASEDPTSNSFGGRSFIIDVEKTKKDLLKQEDTDSNCQITIEDEGPKIFPLGTLNSEGFRKFEVRGTYQLSNLLQELAIASEYGRRTIVLSEDRLNENPVERLNRLIKYNFWDALTRRMDSYGLEKICQDPKNRGKDQRHRVYVPFRDSFALEYYLKVQSEKPHLNLVVESLPPVITPEYVKSINKSPGILSLSLTKGADEFGNDIVRGTPFVVPGGRFNEMYGWDSYFEALGLLVDGRVGLARGMIENFWYELEHYDKILNANRSYYLTRSQPPFLTDMMIETHKSMQSKPSWTEERSDKWIQTGIRAAIKELFGVWLARPRIDESTGMIKYHPEGLGIPPETEESHFDHVLKPFADALEMDVAAFADLYQKGDIKKESRLDEYFLHDRAVRESGHDTTYRFDGRCANLATVDLNSLIYKYEKDLESMIEKFGKGRVKFRVRKGPGDSHYNDFLEWSSLLQGKGVEGMIGKRTVWNSFWARGIFILDPLADRHLLKPSENDYDNGLVYHEPFPDDDEFFVVSLPASLFGKLAMNQKSLIEVYLWCPQNDLYYDYDCSISLRSVYKTCTAFWPLWAHIPSPERAEKLLKECLKYFLVEGGLVSGTEESRGSISLSRPSRQWDYPYGWAPHQILAWKGLLKYGFNDEIQELVYRWLFSITKSFAEYNGVVPEKFDVVNVSHLVNVEYGNVGTDFHFVAKEGFGWMNASYQIGLPLLSPKNKRHLGALNHPDKVFVK